MTRRQVTRMVTIAITALAVAAAPAGAGDSADTARPLAAAAAPDAFERAVVRLAPTQRRASLGVATAPPDWPERAALARAGGPAGSSGRR
jgi:hypothetical protein